MKKMRLLDIVFILTTFTLIGSADAAIVAADPAAVSDHDQSYTQPSTVSPASGTGNELARGVFGDSGQTQQGANFNFFLKGASSENPHSESKISLWLFLLVAAVFGIVSEIVHRLTNTR